MRTTSMVAMLVLMLGCRDEQAGPKNKARPSAPVAPSGASAQGLKVFEQEPRLTWRSGSTWSNGAVTYLGSLVEPEKPQAGQQVVLHHYFRANTQVPSGYRFFVHVLDATSGQQVGNLDHEVQNGAAPLGSWPVGKIIEDAHGFQMPSYEGSLRLMLGFWTDSGRLPVDTGPHVDQENRAVGPTLGGAPAAPLPEYRMPKTSSKPVIDGKLDDEVWKAAQAVTLTTSFDGKTASKKTTLRMLYDDANIYVAFDAEDTDIWGTFRQKDDPIYNEDACEVFFDANGDGATYNELQVSPHNVNFDASFVARRSDLPTAMKWESGMTTAVQVKGTLDDDSDKDERWTAEMQIPIANLNTVPHVPPLKGDVWRFNAYRLEHLVRRKQIEGQSFAPLFMGDFHHLPRFGRLIFE